MGIRNIAIPIDLTKTGGVVFPTENKVVYTNDTVSLTFNLTGITSYAGVTASVSLVMKDGSIFQHEKPVTASPAVFSLKENEVQHAGPVVGQVAFTDVAGTITSQEFIFTIRPSVLDASENLELLKEVEVDSFLVLKSQVEGIQLSVLANWDTIQAELGTMEADFAADWSEWFTTNKNSISSEWVALKSDISAKQATLAQDITTAEANELERVAAEAIRLSQEGTRTTAESDRVEEEAVRLAAESDRAAKEIARGNKEQERISAEATRLAAESARITAESTRFSQENLRVSHEEARVSQENARQAAEALRASLFLADHNTALTDHDTIVNLFQNSSVVLSVDEYMELLKNNNTLPTIRYIVTDSALEEFLGAPLT